MGVSYNPSIVTNGLVLCLDAASSKSLGQTTNLMNPSVRNHTGGVSGYWSGQINANNTQQGFPSFRVTTVNNTLNDGFIAFGNGINLTNGVTYTWSLDVWVPIDKSIQVRIRAASGGGAVAGTELNIAGQGQWVRYSKTFVANTNSSSNIEGTELGPTTDIFSFWIKNLQLEQQPYANPFVNGSAIVWSDIFSNSRNLGLGGILYSPLNLGYLVFNGINSRVDIPPDNFDLDEFTIHLWFRSNNISQDFSRILHKADTSGQTSGFLIAQSNIDGKLVFVYQPQYTANEIIKRSSFLIEENIWYCLTMTYSVSSGIKIYFNGIEDLGEESSSPDVGWTSNTGNLFSIGSRSGGTQVFNGDISQVFIYQRELTQTEILKNYNTHKSRFVNENIEIITNNLVLYLDAGNPDSYPGSGNTWFDLSGFGRNFNWVSSPSFTSGTIPYFSTLGNRCTGPASNSLGIDNTSGYTIFLICEQNALVSTGAFKFYKNNLSGISGRAIFTHCTWSDDVVYFDQGGCCSSNTRTSAPSEGSQTWNIWTFRRFSNSSTRTISKNGNTLVTNTASAATIDLDSRGVDLGSTDEYGGNSSTWNAKLGGFIVYNRGLSDAEILDVVNVFKFRYGIQ